MDRHSRKPKREEFDAEQGAEAAVMTTMQDQIRQILSENGRLSVPVESLDEHSDLFAAGLDSLAIVNVLMSLEETFDIELPDDKLSRKSFASIGTIRSVVEDLAGQAAHS